MMGPRWLPAAAATVFAAALAWLNRGERVAIDVGVVTFYRAPLAVVLLVVFLAGMLSMLLLGLRHDRRVRDELRRHGLLQPAAPAPARPAASAWGVAREPAREDERTVAYPREDERTVSYARDDERTIAYPDADEQTVSYARDDERTVAYPDADERTVSYSREDERPVRYPRLDEDPAA